MVGDSSVRVRRVAGGVVFMVVAVVGGAVVAGASTPDWPPNARGYEAVCHRPGTNHQRTLILKERSAAFLTKRLGAADAPCGVPLSSAAEGVEIDAATGYFVEEDGYFVEEIESGLYWVTEGVYQMMFLTTGEGVIVVDAPPTIGPNILAAIGAPRSSPMRTPQQRSTARSMVPGGSHSESSPVATSSRHRPSRSMAATP